jgi:hypothetical protein
MAIRRWMARAGVLMLLASLGWQMGVSPVLSAAAPTDVFAVSDRAIRDGRDAHLVSPHQATDTRADERAEPDTGEELGRIAALTTILDRQGSRSAGNLERVSSIEVLNLAVGPEFVVDAREERGAAAQAAAAEAASTEATRSAEAAAEAQVEATAAVAAALAADQVDDEAEVAAVVATQEAKASAAVVAALAADKKDDDAQAAALTATREAEVAASDATATAEAQAAASAVQAAEAATAKAEAQAESAVESNRQFVQRATMLLLSLALLSGGLLCLRFWRNRKEPFVLKAIPGSETAHAHA